MLKVQISSLVRKQLCLNLRTYWYRVLILEWPQNTPNALFSNSRYYLDNFLWHLSCYVLNGFLKYSFFYLSKLIVQINNITALNGKSLSPAINRN